MSSRDALLEETQLPKPVALSSSVTDIGETANGDNDISWLTL
jgi:hypothetical protein